MNNNILEEQLNEMRILLLEDLEDKSKDKIFEIYLKQAKNIALNVLYPFDLEKDELPLRISKDWQIRVAIYLYNSYGEDGYTSYSENGLSWVKESGYVPLQLLNELTPTAGVPR